MSRSLLLKITSISACLVLFPTISARAWGPQGHETIATVARDILVARNPQAANEIYAIIKANDLPTQFKVRPTSKNPYPQPANCRIRTIASVANWPDCVRTTYRYGSTAKFHYDDIPRCPTATTLPAKAGYCANGGCGSTALGNYIAALKNMGTPPGKRAEALSFIMHIVGDLHQPMHAVDNGNDSGGNFVTVRIEKDAFPLHNGNADNLHSLWDGDLVEAAIGLDTKAGIDRVRKLADARASEWSSTDPDTWALESHKGAEIAYSQLTKPPVCNAGKVDGGDVTAIYVSDAAAAVEVRLAAAAVRLAAVLEDALGKPQ